MRTTVLVVGGGIGGLATALTLHGRGIDCRVFEQSTEIRELGVGINTLPHAIGELAELGLLERLDGVGLRTYELIYMNRFGQKIWHELRGVDAGHAVPQFSIHRGALQGVLRDAVIERLGSDAIVTGLRLVDFEQDDGGVSARFVDAGGRRSRPCVGTCSLVPTGSTRRSGLSYSPARGRRSGTGRCSGVAQLSGRLS